MSKNKYTNVCYLSSLLSTSSKLLCKYDVAIYYKSNYMISLLGLLQFLEKIGCPLLWWPFLDMASSGAPYHCFVTRQRQHCLVVLLGRCLCAARGSSLSRRDLFLVTPTLEVSTGALLCLWRLPILILMRRLLLSPHVRVHHPSLSTRPFPQPCNDPCPLLCPFPVLLQWGAININIWVLNQN